jgi:hypothetical protein
MTPRAGPVLGASLSAERRPTQPHCWDLTADLVCTARAVSTRTTEDGVLTALELDPATAT